MGIATGIVKPPESRSALKAAISSEELHDYPSFTFMGTVSCLPQSTPEDPIKEGSVVHCIDTNAEYCYLGDAWIEIGSTEVTYSPNDVSLVYEACKIAREKCSTCGAPLPLRSAVNGICKCEYCRSENYIW